MVELSASSVVCRAICAIRLTTLPIAAEDSLRRSTLARASLAAVLARSASLPASRTCAPMPTADWVNFSVACAKVVAVPCAALVRPVRASVRWRMSARVAAVASAPPATELAARSSLADHAAELELEQFEDLPRGIRVRRSGCGSLGCRRGRRDLWLDGRRSRFRHSFSTQTERHALSRGQLSVEDSILTLTRELVVKNCLISRQAALPAYRNRHQIFDFARGAAYKAALPTRIRPDESVTRDRMAGHSQFKNIMHRKGRQDAQKSKLFGKLAREITVAAKLGTPDPDDEPAAARGHRRGAPGEHAQGQYRARHQEGDRRRGR